MPNKHKNCIFQEQLLLGKDLSNPVEGLPGYQNWMVFMFHVPVWNEKWLVQEGTQLERGQALDIEVFGYILLVLKLKRDGNLKKRSHHSQSLGEYCWEF
ncbi:hypothetical protein Tco_0544233 [Tanacetum coccineum]